MTWDYNGKIVLLTSSVVTNSSFVVPTSMAQAAPAPSPGHPHLGIPGRAGEAQATHIALLPGAGAGGAPLGDAEGAHLAEDLARRRTQRGTLRGTWGHQGKTQKKKGGNTSIAGKYGGDFFFLRKIWVKTEMLKEKKERNELEDHRWTIWVGKTTVRVRKP